MSFTQKCVLFSICPGQQKSNFYQIHRYQRAFMLENV